ncbi:MAG: hypothetical protein Ct9H300mP3_09800 [Gammaproteobacteria bacterium]|nr:MAG: hypothetical protein Ct9H300mP3_09800 [Gammaproteobacteria bacterium]
MKPVIHDASKAAHNALKLTAIRSYVFLEPSQSFHLKVFLPTKISKTT